MLTFPVPIDINENVFSQEMYDGGLLCVPKGSGDLYRNTFPWNKFKYIEELEDDLNAFESIETTTTSDSPCYDLTGRKLQQPVRGQFYVQDGKKFLAK